MTDQPLTDKLGTTDEPLVQPEGTIVPNSEPSAEIDYSIPQPIVPIPGMRKRYKFFQLAILNPQEELKFNKEFADEGWAVAGVSQHGPRVVVLGVRLEPAIEIAGEEEVAEEETDLGSLGGEVDEKDVSKDPVRRPKVVDPFR